MQTFSKSSFCIFQWKVNNWLQIICRSSYHSVSYTHLDVYKRQAYGLYAREDIVYPDGATRTIYKAGEQVASLTTDDKGQALSLIHI